MIVVDFSKFLLVFGAAFIVLFAIFLMILLALASGGKKRSAFVKSFIYFGLLFIVGLVLAYYNPAVFIGWLQ